MQIPTDNSFPPQFVLRQVGGGGIRIWKDVKVRIRFTPSNLFLLFDAHLRRRRSVNNSQPRPDCRIGLMHFPISHSKEKMNQIPIFCLAFFAIFSPTYSQTLSPKFSGCVVKNGQNQPAVIADNTTFADENWWYQCVGTVLTAKGCVVDGKRFNLGEYFMAYSENFYGVCENVDGRYLKATILGCLDINNDQIEPGNNYVLNRRFWANCTSTKKTVHSPTLGNVELDVIRRQVIGCNDGTYDIIKPYENFGEMKVDEPLTAGLGLICRLDGPFPTVQPVVCLIANSSKDLTYVVLGSKCYSHLHEYLYYCEIENRDFHNGTVEYSWEIGWDISTPEYLASLQSKSFHDCENQSTSPSPHIQNTTATAPPAIRRKRPNFDKSARLGAVIAKI